MTDIKSSIDDLRKEFEDASSLRNAGYRGRYAPSPTGTLHIGNLRTALISWLRARVEGGVWLLRIDDLDSQRNRLRSVEEIVRDLQWLGLTWDGPIIYQSKRNEIYNAVLSSFINKDKIFACKCSRKILRKDNQLNVSNYIYPGTCRDLNLSLKPSKEEHRSLRLKVDKEFSRKCGDIVVRRSDGFISYNFATAIDDLLLGISEIVRGNDLANTKFAQIAVIKALLQKPPLYKHVPIVLNSEGKKLSKREGGISLNYLIEKGMNSSEVIGLLSSSLGLSPINSDLSSAELLSDLKKSKNKIDILFDGKISDQTVNL